MLSNLGEDSTFTITDAKRYVSVVTLSAEDNAKSSELLSERFERPVCWNKYKIILNKSYNENNYIRESLDASYQGGKRLFVLTYRGGGGASSYS